MTMFNKVTKTFQWGQHSVTMETGEIARQSTGAVLLDMEGTVVLATDVTHFYENLEKNRPFTTAFHVGGMLDGFDRLRALAPSPQHIIPGHDPLVMQRYPAVPGLEGIAVQLHAQPIA